MDFNKVSGLMNFGNTCFMNSSLQLLMCCQDLIQLLIDNPLDQNCYQQTFKDYFNVSTRSLGPRMLYNRYKTICGQYDGGTQEDANEYLTFLIDDLDTLITDVNIKERFKKLIKVQMSGNIVCSHCGFFKSWPIPENILMLSISGASLIECFNNTMKKESLDGDNQWQCDRCKCKRDAVKRIKITNIPKYLFVSLNRYEYSNGQIVKNCLLVDIPFSWAFGGYTYVIHGMICHVGDIQGGHYFSYVNRNNQWFFVNDREVKPITWEEISKTFNLVYMLLYTRL